MKRTIRFSPEALSDLDGIWVHSVKEWGERQADDYIRSIYLALNLVESNPRIARDAGNVRPGLFKYPCGSHIVFFRMREKSIDVIRLLHQRMDFSRHF